MKSKPSKHEIIQWLQNPTIETGTVLYHRLRKGTAPKTIEALIKKLQYHFNLPINPEPPIRNPQPETHKPQPVTRNSKPTTPNSQPETRIPQTTTPEFIEKIIQEHAKLVSLRSRLDEQRKALGTDNSEPIKKKRRTFTQSIQQHSARIEMLYKAKEDYYNKAILPDMIALGLQKNSPKPENTNQQTETSKKLTSLRAAQKRDQNLLDFSQTTALHEPNPMPDGPKRRSIMARMEKRLKEIQTLKKL